MVLTEFAEDTSEMTDVDLVVRFREGDETAFEALHKRHAPNVYRYCLSRVCNRQDAEDLCQKVWRDFASSFSRLDEGRGVLPWIFTIAARRVADHHRKRSKEIVAIPESQMMHNDLREQFDGDGDSNILNKAHDRSKSPEMVMMELEEREKLFPLVARLAAKERMAINMRLLGMTNVEIADVLGMSYDAVAQVVFAGKKKLQLLLVD